MAKKQKPKLHKWRVRFFVDRYHFGFGIIMERTEMGWQLSIHFMSYILKFLRYITTNHTARSLAAAAYHYNRIVDLLGDDGVRRLSKLKKIRCQKT